MAKQKTKKEEHVPNDILKELFQAAVNLRGAVEPADYKRYVLPIIFIRFLSIRFKQRREQLAVWVKEPKSEYYATKQEDIEEIINDPVEYLKDSVFMVPEKACWEYIRKHAQADNIKTILDDALELLENTYPDKLRGLLPRIFGGSNLDADNVRDLINLFSKDIFEQAHGGIDLIGRIYEYFIGEFANTEGKRGGEYFTPSSIVRCLVNMLEPETGAIYDPCCGSGGMFVQSDIFNRHNRKLSFYGQESKDFTFRLCKMNLFIHGIDGKIHIGNSYTDDKHAGLKADFILANPPFNDGSKGENGWGADKIPRNDPRLRIRNAVMPLAARNANTMWILHFLHHLNATGSAGFVMATGELSNMETARQEVRKALVDNNYVDCIVQLSGQLFANTQIPCGLWFLSKNREGTGGFRKRLNKVLFIDARRLGSLIPGSRKQKALSEKELEQIAAVYRQFKHKSDPKEAAGFCKAATLEEIRGHNYALTPGRYVGVEETEDEDEPFEERFPVLVEKLKEQFKEAGKLQREIVRKLENILDA